MFRTGNHKVSIYNKSQAKPEIIQNHLSNWQKTYGSSAIRNVDNIYITEENKFWFKGQEKPLLGFYEPNQRYIALGSLIHEKSGELTAGLSEAKKIPFVLGHELGHNHLNVWAKKNNVDDTLTIMRQNPHMLRKEQKLMDKMSKKTLGLPVNNKYYSDLIHDLSTYMDVLNVGYDKELKGRKLWFQLKNLFRLG